MGDNQCNMRLTAVMFHPSRRNRVSWECRNCGWPLAYGGAEQFVAARLPANYQIVCYRCGTAQALPEPEKPPGGG